ncbi:FDXHR family putative zinc-binding protein [Nocardioides massiliensis]|uniref:Phage FDXHR zinc binding domain-containing protein n=1 Tax=Nocardioides massiliensis TaxID=1325935 RepID=A0ABT9NJA8_9ACTN|nr:hypothetical protein [Nocardioides massiliensis]
MVTSCQTCGDTWTGTRLEHCVAGCHRTFSGSTAGDLHRTGDFNIRSGPDRRRCRTDEELAEKGLRPRTTPSGLIVWGQEGQNPWS